VTAFACVTAQSVGQRDYLLEGQQRRRTHDALTRAAACPLATEGVELTRLADRTDKAIRSGCQRGSFHFNVPLSNSQAEP